MQSVGSIGRGNVGRIAERIVANELEYRGFRVSDLNKDGISANADLLAVKNGRTWQIQVKGSSYETQWADGWWFNYGFCTHEMIKDKNLRMFNRASGFYMSEWVVLVCVKSPSDYHCAVLPIEIAETAAQLSLDHTFRTNKPDGSPKKPGKMWVTYNYIPQKTRNPEKKALLQQELDLVRAYFDKWEIDAI